MGSPTTPEDDIPPEIDFRKATRGKFFKPNATLGLPEKTMLQTIINAIRNREYLAFTYSGYSRIVQPAAVGVSKDGNDVLRCYQAAGGHVTPGHEWDFCVLAKISGLRTTGENFVTDPPGYKKGDRHMTRIYAEL